MRHERAFAVMLLLCAGAVNHIAADEGSHEIKDPGEIGNPYVEVTRVEPDAPFPSGHFGHSLAIDGRRLLVGSRGEHFPLVKAAHLFERRPGSFDEWKQIAELAPEGAGDFGGSVALEGGLAAVTGSRNLDSPGHLFLFEENAGGPGQWGEVALIAAPNPVGDGVGLYGISISGDSIVVGSSNDDELGPSSGAAYVFDRDPSAAAGWSWVKLLLPEGGGGAWFGAAVALDGDTLVVGAPNHSRTWVFERGPTGDWTEITELIGTGVENSDDFGEDVDLDGDTAIVLAKGSTDRAYIFERNQGGSGAWGEVAELIPSDGGGGIFPDVEIDGDLAVLGMEYGKNEADVTVGAAYVFQRQPDGSWEEIAKLLASDGEQYDEFGEDIAISDHVIVVGADAVNDHGTAYVFAESLCVLEAKLVERGPFVPGESIQLDVHVEHNRLTESTVPFGYWIEDSEGRVVASHVSATYTYSPGAQRDVRVDVPLSDDLQPGEYSLVVGLDEMNPGESFTFIDFSVSEP